MLRAFPSLLILIAVLAALLVAGCGGFGFAYEKHLSGKYGLVATDVLEQMSVCEMLPSGSGVGVISETVFAVGWDEQYIIAKQHPAGNKSITHFYILRVSDGKLTGPVDEMRFTMERDKIGVPASLSFTLVFDSLK